jgi:hypothetical protein
MCPPHNKAREACRVPAQKTLAPNAISTPSPTSTAVPESEYPGIKGHSRIPACNPAKHRNSVPGLTPENAVRTKISPAPGEGTSTSRTETNPGESKVIAEVRIGPKLPHRSLHPGSPHIFTRLPSMKYFCEVVEILTVFH